MKSRETEHLIRSGFAPSVDVLSHFFEFPR